MEPDTVDAIVTDPPYGLEFMGKSWDKLGRLDAYADSAQIPQRDPTSPAGRSGTTYGSRVNRRCLRCGHYRFSGTPCTCGPDAQWDVVPGLAMQEWHYAWAVEARRVAKPGAHLVAFGGTRTHHRLMCAIEDAGWEIRDCLMWVYGSGFSKSWNFKTQYEGGFCACDGSGKPLPYNHDKEAPEHDLRSLREADLSPSQHTRTQSGQVLLPFMPEHSLSVSDRATRPQPEAPGQQESSLEGRQLHRTREGLPDDSDAIASTGSCERLRTGAHSSGPADVGTSVETKGGSASPKPEQARQQTAESSRLHQSSRSLGDGTPDSGSCCPRCGLLKSEYKGFGTGLKPAYEIIILARKPLIGTVAANVLEHGTGGLNIDGCRVEGAKGSGVWGSDQSTQGGSVFVAQYGRRTEQHAAGRWPANVVHDGSEEVMGLFPETGKSAGGGMKDLRKGTLFQGETNPNITDHCGFGDSGSAARFFYCAKASPSERGEDNNHPTVKPTALMRWLCLLVTPPDGLILDPFCGSGSTGVAASLEGFRFVGIDVDAEYCEIARKRIAAANEQTDLFTGPGRTAPQPDIFDRESA